MFQRDSLSGRLRGPALAGQTSLAASRQARLVLLVAVGVLLCASLSAHAADYSVQRQRLKEQLNLPNLGINKYPGNIGLHLTATPIAVVHVKRDPTAMTEETWAILLSATDDQGSPVEGITNVYLEPLFPNPGDNISPFLMSYGLAQPDESASNCAAYHRKWPNYTAWPCFFLDQDTSKDPLYVRPGTYVLLVEFRYKTYYPFSTNLDFFVGAGGSDSKSKKYFNGYTAFHLPARDYLHTGRL